HINVGRKLQEILDQLEGKLRRCRSRLLGSGGADNSNKIIEQHRNEGETRGDQTSGDRLHNTHWRLPTLVLTIATSAAGQIKSKQRCVMRSRVWPSFWCPRGGVHGWPPAASGGRKHRGSHRA